MKKTVLCALLALSSTASADFLRVEGGIGAWESQLSGTMNYKGDPVFDVDALDYNTETSNYFWVLVKHPVPMVPNVRFEYTELSYSGSMKQGITWEGSSYGAGSSSALELTQYDAIFYYNMLDNTFWATLDLGLDFKYIQSSMQLNEEGGVLSYSESGSTALPMLYGRVRAEIPGTEFGLEADMKYISSGDTSAYDMRIKADYQFDLEPLELGLEVGYRTIKFDVESGDLEFDANADIEMDGLFIGGVVRF